MWGCLERELRSRTRTEPTTRERLGTLNTGWAVFVVLSAGFPGPHVTFPLGVCKRGYCRWLTPPPPPEMVLPFSSSPALCQRCARQENESCPLHQCTGPQHCGLLTGACERPERPWLLPWQQLACCPGSHLQLQLLRLFATPHILRRLLTPAP